MKKYLPALVAMCMFLIAVAAHGAPATTTPGATVSAIERMMLSRQAKAEADIEMLKANAGKTGKSADYDKIVGAVKVEQEAKAKIANSRYYKLREEAKTDRKKAADLAKLVNELGLLEKADREQLVNMAQKLGEIDGKIDTVEKRTTSLETRATGIETRQNVTDAKVAEVAGKVAEVASKVWSNEFAFGLFTGKGFDSAETGFNLRFGARNHLGNGWYASASLGAGDLVSKPRPTSAVVRGGGQFSMGGPRSALTLDVGALAGVAGTSLAANPGVVVGGTVGLTLRPRAWYGFGIGASADLVTGRYTGVGASVGISFSPLGEMQIGE